MSSPFTLLIILPLVAAGITAFLARWQRGTAVFATLFLFLLTWLISRETLPDTFSLLGREMIFSGTVRLVCQVVYLLLAGLFLLTWILPVGSEFVPGALVALAPLAMALLIRPFAFGALALGVAAACLIPVIQTGRAGYTRAALRYLVMVVLAAPLFLLASWMIETDQQPLFNTVYGLLAVGFVMLLAGFPFHLWLTPLVMEASPLATALLLGPVQLVILTFLFQTAATQTDLNQRETFSQLLLWSGVTTAVLGGLISLTARDRARLWGGLVMLDMGMGLFLLLYGNQETAVEVTVARFAALLLSGVGFFLLNQPTSPSWWRVLLFVYGGFSLLGLPLTVGFNGRWAMLTAVSSHSTWLPLLLLASISAAGYGLFKHLAAFFSYPSPNLETSTD